MDLDGLFHSDVPPAPSAILRAAGMCNPSGSAPGSLLVQSCQEHFEKEVPREGAQRAWTTSSCSFQCWKAVAWHKRPPRLLDISMTKSKDCNRMEDYPVDCLHQWAEILATKSVVALKLSFLYHYNFTVPTVSSASNSIFCRCLGTAPNLWLLEQGCRWWAHEWIIKLDTATSCHHVTYCSQYSPGGWPEWQKDLIQSIWLI